MFLLDAPPDTSSYMIAGYTVFFLVSAIYLISLVVRSRNLSKDLTALEEIQQESKVTKSVTAQKPKSGASVATRKPSPRKAKPAAKKAVKKK